MAKVATNQEDPALPDGVIWKGNPRLIPWLISVDDLLLDPANERLHPGENLEGIRASYRRYGQQRQITIDKDRLVRDGNGQLMAVREEGWTHIAALATNLEDEVDLAGYRIAANRTAETAEWSWEALQATMNAFDPTALLDVFDSSFRAQIELMVTDSPFGSLPPIENPGERLTHVDLRVRVRNLEHSENAASILREIISQHPEWNASLITSSNEAAE